LHGDFGKERPVVCRVWQACLFGRRKAL
jgi:hypothetical protein